MKIGIWYRAEIKPTEGIEYTKDHLQEKFDSIDWPENRDEIGRVLKWDIKEILSEYNLSKGRITYSYDKIGFDLSKEFNSQDNTSDEILETVKSLISETEKHFLEILSPLEKESLFSIGDNIDNVVDNLDNENISKHLRVRYDEGNYTLSENENVSISVEESGKEWNLNDENKGYNHEIRKEDGELNISEKEGNPRLANKRILIQFEEFEKNEDLESKLEKYLEENSNNFSTPFAEKKESKDLEKEKDMDLVSGEELQEIENKEFSHGILVKGDYASLIVHDWTFDEIMSSPAPVPIYEICSLGFFLTQVFKDMKYEMEYIKESLKEHREKINDYENIVSDSESWLKKQLEACKLLYSEFPDFGKKYNKLVYRINRFEEKSIKFRDLLDEFRKGVQNRIKYNNLQDDFQQENNEFPVYSYLLYRMGSRPDFENEAEHFLKSYSIPPEPRLGDRVTQVYGKFKNLRDYVQNLTNALLFTLTFGGIMATMGLVFPTGNLLKAFVVIMLLLLIFVFNWYFVGRS